MCEQYDSKTTFIYALIDPSTNEVRYVGKSKDPETRLIEHCKNKQNIRSHKTHWIDDLKKRNLIPKLKIIEECDDLIWEKREIYWIEFYKKIGLVLTNSTSGGEGGAVDTETRKRISEKCKLLWQDEEYIEKQKQSHIGVYNDEVKEKISKSSKELWKTEEFREKRKNFEHSDESKEIMSKKSKMLWEDPEYRATLEAAAKTRYTEEVRKKMSTLSLNKWQNEEYRQKMSKINSFNYQVYGLEKVLFSSSKELKNWCNEKELSFGVFLDKSLNKNFSYHGYFLVGGKKGQHLIKKEQNE
jgi:hypothetical protein